MNVIKWFQASFVEDASLDDAIDAVFDSSDDEIDLKPITSRHGGSRPGRKHNIDRGHQMGANRIYLDYFSHNPVYNDRLFRRRFRMRREVFLRVMDGVQKFDSYFEQKVDAVGKLGLSPIQKVTAAIRQLAYGISADACDEYIRIGESTAAVCLYRFCDAVVGEFGAEYLRSPTPEDLERVLRVNAARGFCGLQGSLDVCNWRWDKCAKARQGQFKGHKGTSVGLEAVVDGDLRFWHVHFGSPGSLNDINICQRSTLLHDIINGQSHKVEFTVNGRIYNMPYFLVDGIYPQWYVFLKAVPDPVSNAETLFTTMHEAIRKDVERGFGVLQARWTMLKMPGRKWSLAKLSKIMHACIILHNMIIEDERHCHKLCQDMDFDMPMYERAKAAEVMVIDMSREIVDGSLAATAARMMATRDHSLGIQLRNDVIAHLWNNHSAMNKE